MSRGPDIFISYRRDDVPLAAYLVYRELCHYFGERRIFFDQRDIPLAVKWWEESIQPSLRSARVVVAIIGSRWSELASHRQENDQQDIAKKELGFALKNKKCLGVLCDDVDLGSHSLLKRLGKLQCSKVDSRSFSKEQFANLLSTVSDLVEQLPRNVWDPIRIAAGKWSAQAGSRRKTIHLTHAFKISRTPVTQRLYSRIMGDADFAHFSEDALFPAESVSWCNAVAFCNAFSEHLNLPSYYEIDSTSGLVHIRDQFASGIRLPTEAEWEYVAHLGSQPVSRGSGVCPSSEEAALGHPLSVGTRNPNGIGVHDLFDNVWQWCWDIYDDPPYGQSRGRSIEDPTGPDRDLGNRVCRGGSFRTPSRGNAAPFRYQLHEKDKADDVGFRLAQYCEC
jgi:hypothetical protein